MSNSPSGKTIKKQLGWNLGVCGKSQALRTNRKREEPRAYMNLAKSSTICATFDARHAKTPQNALLTDDFNNVVPIFLLRDYGQACA